MRVLTPGNIRQGQSFDKAARVLGISTSTTKSAVVVYFFARLAHYVVYTAGIPAARTLTFTAGWLAQIAIIASILRWI